MKLVRKIIYIICSVCLLLISINSIYALLVSKSYIKSDGNQIIDFNVNAEKLQNHLATYTEEQIVDYYYDCNQRNIIKPEIAEQISQYEGIIAMDYTVDIEVDIENAEPVVPRNKKIYNFMAKGNRYENMVEFETGEYELVKGRMYTQEEIDNLAKVCLITEELAAFNNWNIGDKIGISYLLGTGTDIEHLPQEDRFNKFEIIGIYKNNSKDIPTSISTEPGNLILLPSTTIADICVYEYNTVLVDYYLKEVWNEYQLGIERVPMDFYISGIQLLVENDSAKNIIDNLEEMNIEYTEVSGNVKEINNSIQFIDKLLNFNITVIIMLIIVIYEGIEIFDSKDMINSILIVIISIIICNGLVGNIFDYFINIIWYGRMNLITLMEENINFDINNLYSSYDFKILYGAIIAIFLSLFFVKYKIKCVNKKKN